ncbi:hypothetical protein BH24GEM1_BH24GEM1_18160 [soil metagenome]
MSRERARAASAALLIVVLLAGGDPARGRVAARQYGCGTCHQIRGVPGADGLVDPPLDGIGARAYVAGVLTNTPPNLTGSSRRGKSTRSPRCRT